MKRNIRILSLSLFIAALTLGGCGGSSHSANGSYAKENSYSDYAVAEEAYADYEEPYYSDDVYEYEESVKSNDEVDSITDEEIESATTRKLIRTVNITAETKEFDAFVANVQKKITELGGYAQSVNINGSSYEYSSARSASIVARIPAPRLDSFVSNVEQKSNITRKNENAEDVTLSYSDIESHKKALKIEQERLEKLLESADSLETIIVLEQRMTEVRYELESYESRLRTMDNQIEYSTVYLDVNEVKEYKPEPVEELSFGQKLAREFTENCADAFETIQDFIIGFISFIPRLIVIIIILIVIGLVIFGVLKLFVTIIRALTGKKRDKSSKKGIIELLKNVINKIKSLIKKENSSENAANDTDDKSE